MTPRHRRFRTRPVILEQLEHRNLLVGSVVGPQPGPPMPPTVEIPVPSSPYRENVAVVQLNDSAAQGVLTIFSGTPKPTTLTNIWQVEYPSALHFNQALASLPLIASVDYAEPLQLIASSLLPTDEFFAFQFGLHNTGQTVGDVTGSVDADIDAPEAWDKITDAMSIIVADIDSGVDYRHYDLYQNIWINQEEIPTTRRANLTDIDGDGLITFYDLNDPINKGPNKILDVNGNGYIDGGDLLAPLASGGWANGISEDGDQFVDDIIGWDFINGDNDPMDDNGHGTHTTGTIAAMSNNQIGVAGVVWKTQVMALKFLGSDGFGTNLGAAEAIQYSILKGAQVSNNSWGSDGAAQVVTNAVNASEQAGQLFIASAGNDARNIDQIPVYPAALTNSNIISVAATDGSDELADFSNWGAASVDIGAPGDWIVSTFPDNRYVVASGTSMAAPHVAGAVVLLWAQRPNWTYQQIKERLLSQGDALDSLNGFTTSGRRLNLNNAVTNAAPNNLFLSNSTLDENLSVGTLVGLLTSTDPDIWETYTYELVGGIGSTDNGSFQIIGDQLLANASFNFEAKNSYSIRIRTTDELGAYFEKQFTISVNDVIELTGLDVQQGQTQRSYIRYVDLVFEDAAAMLSDLADPSRVRLTRYDLAGNNPVLMSLAAAGLSVANGKLTFDFGEQGITGNRNTTDGDGYYNIEVDLDGDGSFDAVKRFYRLLGDVDGNRAVDDIDANLILLNFGGPNYEYDANGDGAVNSLDRTLAVRSKNRQLTGLFDLDD